VLVTGRGSVWDLNELQIGPWQSAGGTLTIASGGTVNASRILLASYSRSVATVNFGTPGGSDTNMVFIAPIVFGASPALLNFNQADTYTFSDPISGPGSVAQRGSGTTIFTADHTYRGATPIERGTLRLNGTHRGGEAYTVSSGATFGGTGLTDSAVTVQSGGTIRPGNGTAPGVLTVGSLTLDAGGTLNILLGGAISSLLDVNGSVSLSGLVRFTTTGALTADLYPFLSYSNTFAGSFSSNGVPTGYNLFHNTSDKILFLAKPTPVNALETAPLYEQGNEIITGGSNTFGVFVYNASNSSATFNVTNGSNTAGSIANRTLAGLRGTNAGLLTFTGTNVGTNTGSFRVNNTNGSSTNGSVQFLVYDHAKGSLPTNRVSLGEAIVGYTNALGGFLAVSNTNGFRVALATRSTNSGWTNLRITDVTGVLAGASDNLGLSLQGQGTGTFSSNVAVTFADSSTLNGASTNVGTTNFTVTATVYGHAAGSLSAQTVDLGEAIVGFTNSLTRSVGVSNAAGFRVALRSSSGSTNGNLSVGDLTSLAAGSATNLAVGLRNQGVGVFSNNVAVTFADSSTLNGFSTNLGTTNFSATGKIYDHASGRIVGSSGISFVPVHVGYTNQLAGDGSLTLSNTAGFRVALKTTNSTTNARLGLGTVSNLSNGSSTNLLATLAVGQGVGRFTNMVTVTFADNSALNGASTNVGSTNIAMSGYVYSGQSVWLGGSGDWTDFDNWQVPGGTPGLDGALSINDTATFGTGGGGTASLQTNASLLSVIFNSPTSYTVAGDGILSLSNSGGTSASISTLAGRHAIATALRLAGGNVGLIGSAGTELVLEGPVNGSGSLTQQGTGTTTVTGANTYTGTTTLTNGTFILNGTHTGGGAYTAANRGTLGGVGRTASAVTVNSGGTIKPGNGTAPGILTVGGLTLNSGGTLNILLGGAASSLLDVEGNVTLAGAVSFSTNSSLTASLYPFLNYTGTLSGVFAQTNALPEGFELVYGSSKSVFLTKTGVTYAVGPLFDGTNAVITGGTLPFDVEVYNKDTNSVTFTAAGDTNTTGNAGPATVNPTNSGNASGLTWNGTSVGTNTGSFTATFSNGVNPLTTNIVPVTVLVYDHAKGSLGTNTIALGEAIVGYTGPLTGSLAVSNTNGFRVALATASTSTNPNLDVTDVAGVLPGSAEDITVGLSGQGAGVFTNDVTVTYADSSTLAGASTNLGTANFTVTGTIYNHASGSFVGGTNIDLGLVRVGYTAPVTGTNSLVITNEAGLRVALGSINNYDTDDLSLGTVSGLAKGSSTNLSATLGVGRAGGLYTNLVNVTFFDASSLNGASTNVGTATVSVTSYIYTGQGVWLGGSGDWTMLTNWQVPGGIPGLDGALSVNDTATFDTNGTGGTANLTNDAVLRSITFSNVASYTIAGSGSIALEAASGGPATIANLAGSHTISNAINAGSTLQVTGASGTELTLAGLISGFEGLTKSGEGTLTLAAAGNAYRGETVIEGGSLQAGTNGTMSPNSLVRVRGGTFDLNGTTNTVAGLILHNATNTQAAGALTTLKPGAPDDSLMIAGEVGDVAQYNLSGGSINVMGSLQVGYFGNGTFNQTGGTNTVLSDFVFVVGRHVGANGVYNLTGGEASHSGLAGFTIIGEQGTGVMNVSGTGVFNAAASMYIGYTTTGDGTVNINDGGTVNTRGVVFGEGTGRLNFDRADTYTFSAPISGGTAAKTSVTKNGTGTVTLDDNNTYAGTTTVSNGTLFVNGRHTGGAAYTVKPSGTLGGIGQIGSAVTVEAGGTIAPGIGGNDEELIIGSLTLDGALNVVLGGNSSSLLLVRGDATLNAASSVVNFSINAALTASLYPFVSYTGALTGVFGSTNGVPLGYEVIYDEDDKVIALLQSSIDLPAAPVYTQGNAVITGGKLPFGVFVYNNTTNTVDFTAASGVNTTGAVTPAIPLDPETSDIGNGLEWSGTTVGLDRSGSFDVTFSNATTLTTNTVSVTVSVYDHASNVATGNSIGFAPVHASRTSPVASTNGITVSNSASGGPRVALGVTNINTNSSVTISDVRNLEQSNSTLVFGTLVPSTAALGKFTNTAQLISFDDSLLNGAITLGTNEITVTGYVYSGQGEWNTTGGGDWANIDQWQVPGGTPGLDGTYSVNDTAFFGTNGTGPVTNNGSVQMLSMTFSNTNPYNIVGAGKITLTDAGTNAAAIKTLAGSHTISNAVELLESDLTLSNALDTGLTLAGVVSGPNGLLKKGVGTTTLSGANTYLGDTMIEQGTVIATKTGALGGSEVTLNGPGTGTNNTSLLVDASGGDVIISNAINVANQGTGVTTIGSSALNANPRPVQFTGPIDLAKDVTLVSAPYAGGMGDRTDFSGGISGTGNVSVSTATNSRVVFMAAANTFDGDVIITPGSTLQLSDGTPNDSELIPVGSTVEIGAGAALKLAKGGNSETIGGLTGTGIVEAIAGPDRLIIDSVADAIFNGTLKDGGSSLALTKTGAGKQTLGGNNTYTGGTKINAGTLAAASVTALGAGPVELLGGTLELQSPLSIASLLWNGGGGATQIAIPTPGANFLTVASPVTLLNGVNNFNLAGATLSGPVKLLVAPGVSTNSLSLFGVEGVDNDKYTLSYIGDELWLVLVPQPAPTPEPEKPKYPDFKTFAGNPNQIRVAKALNQWAASNPAGDRKTVLDAMTNSGDYQNAFDQMMPSLYASLPTMAFNQANALNTSMFQRMWMQRLNGQGFSSSGMEQAPIQDGKQFVSKNPVAEEVPVEQAEDRNWGIFADGNGIFATANSGAALQDYKSQSGGVSAGASYRWNENLATGVYVGYQGLQAQYDNGSRLTDNAVRFGGFGTYGVGGFYANGLIGGAYHTYDADRNIEFGSIDRTARGDTGAGEFDLALSTGYDIKAGHFTLGPVTSLQYTYLNVQGFQENGADSLNLDVQGYNSSSLLYSLGAQAAYRWEVTKNFAITPMVSASWQHEFLQNAYTINSSFNTGGPSTPFGFQTSQPQQDYFMGGAGVGLDFGSTWEMSFFWNAVTTGNQNLNSQNLYLSIGAKF